MSLHRTADEVGSASRQSLLFATDYDRTPAPPPPPSPPANRSPQSQIAADAIRDAAPSLRARVYEAICRAGSRGMIRHEIVAATQIDMATVTPRVTELIRLGMITESGTRPSPKNRPAGVLFAIHHQKESSPC